ncbi:MAG TPA: hypothetical protein VNM92_00850 [Thermoanaerobaculia bacterium]|nr:hypothetical protein [Thermoanaerobaculia bacterium]
MKLLRELAAGRATTALMVAALPATDVAGDDDPKLHPANATT